MNPTSYVLHDFFQNQSPRRMYYFNPQIKKEAIAAILKYNEVISFDDLKLIDHFLQHKYTYWPRVPYFP